MRKPYILQIPNDLARFWRWLTLDSAYLKQGVIIFAVALVLGVAWGVR